MSALLRLLGGRMLGTVLPWLLVAGLGLWIAWQGQAQRARLADADRQIAVLRERVGALERERDAARQAAARWREAARSAEARMEDMLRITDDLRRRLEEAARRAADRERLDRIDRIRRRGRLDLLLRLANRRLRCLLEHWPEEPPECGGPSSHSPS